MQNSTPARRVRSDEQAPMKPLGQRRLSEKSMSFHGRPLPTEHQNHHYNHHHQQQQQQQQQNNQTMRRLKTEPSELASLATFRAMSSSSLQVVGGGGGGGKPPPPLLIKLLLNVTIQGSLGAVQVVMSQEATVDELIGAAVRQYVKEGRRPALEGAASSGFDLHYSQFSFDCLKREEKVVNLGSRNFFLCRKSVAAEGGEGDGVKRCSKEAEKEIKVGLPWLKFMNFLQ